MKLNHKKKKQREIKSFSSNGTPSPPTKHKSSNLLIPNQERITMIAQSKHDMSLGRVGISKGSDETQDGEGESIAVEKLDQRENPGETGFQLILKEAFKNQGWGAWTAGKKRSGSRQCPQCMAVFPWTGKVCGPRKGNGGKRNGNSKRKRNREFMDHFKTCGL